MKARFFVLLLVGLLVPAAAFGQSKVDYESTTAVKLVGETGEVLPLTIEKGLLRIGDVAIDAKLADQLVTVIQAWKAKGTFGDVQAGSTTARAYTIDQAAAEWKARYLANKTTGERITNGGKSTRTIIGVGPDFFYLDNGVQLPYASAAANWTWSSDSKAVGVNK